MPSKSARPPDEYKEFLRSLQLVGIALVECHFTIDRNMFFEKEEEFFLDSRFEVSKVEKDVLELTASFSARAARSEKEDGSMKLEAVYMMHFGCGGGAPCNRNLADRFVKSEARVILWPYLRELASEITARASVPPVTLPLAVGRRQSS